MQLPKLYYNDFNLENILGEVPKLRFKTTVRDINRSPGLDRLVHISRITFNVELHDAKDSSSPNEVGSLGTTNSRTCDLKSRLFSACLLHYPLKFYHHRTNVRNT